MDCGCRSRADLRAEVVQRGEGCFSASLFDQWTPLHDGYWFRSRLNQGRGAPAVSVAFGVPSPEGPPAGAEVGHLIQRETLPSGRPRLLLLQRTRELQRCGSDASAAVRPQAAAVTRARGFAPRSHTGSNNELLLAQFVCASSRCFAPQEFGTNVSPGSADAVKSLRTRLFGRSQFGHNDRE